jgi:hypothetical protein
MSYVDSVLQPGERIIMRGRLHWSRVLACDLFLVLGVAGGPGKSAAAWRRLDLVHPSRSVRCSLSRSGRLVSSLDTEIAVTDGA